MNEFFSALKTDLMDRRLVPFVALVLVALLGAIGYVVVGGSSSSSTPATPAPSVSATTGLTGGLAISQSTPDKAVAETTDGAVAQRQGPSRNPFNVLPSVARAQAAAAAAAKAATAAAAKAAAKPTSSSGSSTSSGSGSSGTSGASTPTPTKTTTPSKPAKPQIVYHVAILFGITPAATTPPGTPLTPYANLKLLTPLPTAEQPLVVFRGVTAGGKSATFTLVGEAILHGNGTCLPSPSQCQAIDLRPAQTEQLEFIQGGQTVTYELQIVSITGAKASTAAVKSLMIHGESKSGREVLRRAGLLSIPYLSYSSQVGVLVFAARKAAAFARAHAAAGHRRSR
ncbi:MAG TPA: hypothetical protein VII01_06365 [Solirubrobacteraceae bacterium]